MVYRMQWLVFSKIHYAQIYIYGSLNISKKYVAIKISYVVMYVMIIDLTISWLENEPDRKFKKYMFISFLIFKTSSNNCEIFSIKNV